MPKIKDLPYSDRPREKLAKHGPARLSSSELLAIILRTGGKDINVIELARRVLKKFSAEKLPEASYKELANTFGLGATKAAEIAAVFELGRRLLKGKKAQLILRPEHVWHALKDIREHKKEHFVVFFLDSRNQEIKREIISVGTLNASLVHPREVFEPAIEHHAAQVLVAHNHPSGSTEPSEEDMAVTKKLIEAGKILDIEVVDHVIVSKTGYSSVKERGRM